MNNLRRHFNIIIPLIGFIGIILCVCVTKVSPWEPPPEQDVMITASSDPVQPEHTTTITVSLDPATPNRYVSLTVQGKENSGGHQHNEGRPTGLDLDPSSGDTENGEFQADYTASPYGGVEIIKATIQGEGFTYNLNVRISGLINFPGGTGCDLCGETDTHPSNHYCTSTTSSRIQQLGSAYKTEFSEDLFIDDMSLIYGGLFDIGANWDTPHSEHREGKNADVYPTGTPTEAKWTFIKDKIIDLGSTYLDESGSEHPHIHFRE